MHALGARCGAAPAVAHGCRLMYGGETGVGWDRSISSRRLSHRELGQSRLMSETIQQVLPDGVAWRWTPPPPLIERPLTSVLIWRRDSASLINDPPRDHAAMRWHSWRGAASVVQCGGGVAAVTAVNVPRRRRRRRRRRQPVQTDKKASWPPPLGDEQ